MSKLVTLKNSTEFGNVYKTGRSFANRCLILYVVNNGLDHNRYGISVSKRVGNSVVRHRTARLIRESFRLSGHMLNSGLDIVAVARAGIRDKDYFTVNDAVLHLAGLHKILLKNDEKDTNSSH